MQQLLAVQVLWELVFSTVFYVELQTCSVWTVYNSLDEPETED